MNFLQSTCKSSEPVGFAAPPVTPLPLTVKEFFSILSHLKKLPHNSCKEVCEEGKTYENSPDCTTNLSVVVVCVRR
jgi:hypothetical protein